MKKLTKRSILAVLALVLAVVTLGTTSYAWFTLGNTVIVSDIELNVQGGEGLEVSYVPKLGAEKGYVSVLSATDLLNYLAADYGLDNDETFVDHFEWDAVTSVDGRVFKSFSLDQEERVPDLTLISDTQTLGSGMIEFDLRFRTKAASTTDAPVGLIWSQVTLDSGEEGKTWAPEVAFTNSKGTDIAAGVPGIYFASDAARVSITDTKANATVVYENAEDDNGTNTVLTNNEPNWDQGAHDYYKNVTQVDLAETFGEEGDEYKEYKAAQTVTAVPTYAVAMFTTEADPEGYYTADITIRIYIEGFDAEAFNSILSGMINVGLQFKLKTDVPTP